MLDLLKGELFDSVDKLCLRARFQLVFLNAEASSDLIQLKTDLVDLHRHSVDDRPMKKSKNRGKKKIQELFVIDEDKNLVFDSEEKVFEFFEEPIQRIEELYQTIRRPDDFSDDEQIDLEDGLDLALTDPDEIWLMEDFFKKAPIHVFVKTIVKEKLIYDYVAIVFLSTKERNPTFVLSHFPTKFKDTAEPFKDGEMIFSQEMEIKHFAGLEGDSILENDELSIGLFKSMLKLRYEKDIPLETFKNFLETREDTIEAPDEIWRKTDHDGNVFVTFIKEYTETETGDFYYVSVTLEENNSEVHTLLFSFPTNDENLVDRYRLGENLQAEEVSQESSH